MNANGPVRLAAAFFVALTLHVAAIAALTLWESSAPDSAPGEQEITIDLAPAMTEAETISVAETAASVYAVEETSPIDPPDPMEAEAIPPETVAEAVPLETAQVPPEVQAIEALPDTTESLAPPPDAVTLPPPEEVTAKPLPQPEKKPEPTPPPKPKAAERKPRPTPPKPVAERRSASSAARAGSASSSRENTGGSAASADPTVMNRYVGQLASALRRRLRYPDVARSRSISGVATVRFTMTRSGQILGATLVRSAGHPALDQAALAAARPGSSLPAAPDSLPQQQFTFSVPLRFMLR